MKLKSGYPGIKYNESESTDTDSSHDDKQMMTNADNKSKKTFEDAEFVFPN